MLDDQACMDFTTALAQEYHDVFSPLCGYVAEPHDVYEVLAMAHGSTASALGNSMQPNPPAYCAAMASRITLTGR